MNEPNTFVRGYYIDDKICDDLIKFFNLNKHQAVEGASINKDGKQVDFSIKKCIEMFVKPDLVNLKPYLKALNECVKKYVDEFKTLHNTNKVWDIKSDLKIQKYTAPGDGYFRWHCERDGDEGSVNKLLVFMTYLTDTKNAGTEFKYQKKITDCKKGSTVIWPTDWTHTHRGIISKKQEKTIVTGWWSFLAP